MTRKQTDFFKRTQFVKRELEKRGNKILNLKNATKAVIFENAHFCIETYRGLSETRFGGQLELICEILPDVETA
jgi:hypothetical protein